MIRSAGRHIDDDDDHLVHADEEALAQFGEGDLGIVNYALTLEYIEAAFYADVIKSGLFKGDDLALIREIGSNEDEHVVALEATAKLLGTPAPKPKSPRIKSKELLGTAGTIVQVEARHAARVRLLNGESPFA